MKTQDVFAKSQTLMRQRNRLLIACSFLGVLCLLLGATQWYWVGKERIIIAPPHIQKEFWISGNQVSDSYLEQLSQYFASLLLNVSPSTFAVQSEHLLMQVVPEYFSAFKAQLVQQQLEIERRGMSTSFHPLSFKVDSSRLLVELKGHLKIMMGNTALESQTKTYRLQFVCTNGRLWIQSFEEIKDV